MESAANARTERTLSASVPHKPASGNDDQVVDLEGVSLNLFRSRTASPLEEEERDALLESGEDKDIDREPLARTPPSLKPSTTTRNERRGLAIGLLFLTLVVDPPFVVYLFVAIGITMGIARRRAAAPSSPTTPLAVRSRGLAWAATVGTIVAYLVVYQFVREFEIHRIDLDFQFPELLATSSPSSTTAPPPTTSTPANPVSFFRMYNPDLDYLADIEVIHRHMNNRLATQTQRLVVDRSMDVWTSDVYRYEFLRHVWRSTAATPAYRVVCLAESDFVFNEAYIASIVAASDASQQPLELAHAQHFWGHQKFEPFNIGLACTSTHASFATRTWAAIASFLHRKRYRRLLYLDFLYAFVPQRVVLYWDLHHGCASYYPHCKYIHFTRPKVSAIADALDTIQAKNASTVH